MEANQNLNDHHTLLGGQADTRSRFKLDEKEMVSLSDLSGSPLLPPTPRTIPTGSVSPASGWRKMTQSEKPEIGGSVMLHLLRVLPSSD